MLFLFAALLSFKGYYLCAEVSQHPCGRCGVQNTNVVGSDARLFRFCRSKCHKNFKMKRNPRKLKWTKAFRKSAGKGTFPPTSYKYVCKITKHVPEMVVDTTLEFAARRNVPVRYNRETIEATVKGISRINEIRARRERVFYKKRMAGNKEREREANRKLVAENEHLLPKMRASERAALVENGVEGLDEQPIEREKTKVFGKMKVRRKALVDGGVEDEMQVD
jgi:large subunit ribosomal protein L24e